MSTMWQVAQSGGDMASVGDVDACPMGGRHDWLGPTDDNAPICRKCEKVMRVTEGDQ